ncbi:hypothetical protein [Parageobacillus thermoglucosidasius]
MNISLSSQVLHKFFAMMQQGAPGHPGGGFNDGFAAVTFSHVSITSLAE